MAEPRVVVRSAKSGRVPSVVPMLASVARTLDISVRWLAKTAAGPAQVDDAQGLLIDWARDIFRYANATLSVEGLEHVASATPYVVMSNHASLMDIPALIATFPGVLRMVTKEELTRVPIWGRAMIASGFIPIDRSNRERAIEQLELAKQRLREGIAVWIAPEGTRGRGRVLEPFKKGGFHLARQLGAPILPAFVDGTSTMLPRDAVRVAHDVDVVVRYGEPISADVEDVAALMQRVREAIVDASRGALVDVR